METGYYVAKNTLSENFGKPHIIAKAHIKKLKQADGQSLLEFARHLDVCSLMDATHLYQHLRNI